ncbi:hypothetical protein CWE24_11565 [Pseudidiomarina donghaiensis]|uniref:Uncharacterized protein n=1 Tax=Pseudidiomarina donghaiensis TaxID=519452 RepID=A0A432XCC4_9GAMM|nr:hypothetical protein CWE24_11565 [Pseudidiomarina donghaiensis]SFV24804.1 hypothetical protein SAMN04488139_2464 [Pseudidiomarina donghaiensis]
MNRENQPVKLGAVARVGAGFILFCTVIAFLIIAYFLIVEGITLSGIAFILACVVGCYLFAYMTFRGQVPPIFRWLE